jgi:hypothetical protein
MSSVNGNDLMINVLVIGVYMSCHLSRHFVVSESIPESAQKRMGSSARPSSDRARKISLLNPHDPLSDRRNILPCILPGEHEPPLPFSEPA